MNSLKLIALMSLCFVGAALSWHGGYHHGGGWGYGRGYRDAAIIGGTALAAGVVGHAIADSRYRDDDAIAAIEEPAEDVTSDDSDSDYVEEEVYS